MDKRKHGNLDCLGGCGYTANFTWSHCSNHDIWWEKEEKTCIYCRKIAKLVETDYRTCEECFRTERWRQFRKVK